VTNIRLLWKSPFRLQRYSFITTLFLGPFDDVITKFYCIYNCSFLNDIWFWLRSCKSKVVPVFNTLSTTSWRRAGERRHSPIILNQDPRWKVSGQLYAPASFTPRAKYPPPVPITYGACWAPERTISCSCRESNSEFSVVQPVDYSIY
jgi:hypothetical protein